MQVHIVGFAWEQLIVTRMGKKKNLFLVLIVETVVGVLLDFDSLSLISYINVYQTLETVLYWYFKHLKCHPKNSAIHRFF